MAELLRDEHVTPGHLGIEANRCGDEVALALPGELDLASSPALERRLSRLHSGDVRRLVLDLRSLEFMDSTGLQTVLGAHREAEPSGRQLVLRRGRAQVQRLFELTGVLERLAFVA